MLKNKVKITLLSLLALSSMKAQNLNSSPYTRFGLGELINLSNTPYTGMGGASIALASFNHINFANPATYGTILKHNPIFDVGFMGKTSALKTDQNAFNATTISLRDFSLLMPVSSRTGFVFGLMPYSNTGYDITSFDANGGDTITYNFNGTGSVNRLLFGLGQQIINRGDSVRFSMGVNASYLFGTLQKGRTVGFQDVSYFSTKLIDKSIIRGFVFDVGLHYYEKVSDKLYFQLGATAKIGSNVNGYHDFYAYNFKYASDGVTESSRDTVESMVDAKGKYALPKGIGFGGAVTFKNRITLSAQYEFQDWQNYYETFDSVDYNPNELSQSYQFSYGMEVSPTIMNNTKNVSAFKLSTYRIGFNHGQTPYYLSNTHLKHYGISFGISIPLISSSSTSSMSFGFELGKMGTTENGLIQDNYLKFNVGFSLSPNSRFDRWFKKRLYD